ncbi:hypothetical protein CGCS363_v012028 [Colletotrichum siamense]|uniref:uncharacterized protein n=1 Tax=Colletotrichum siamense TaxID=690259 RepID=UPI001872AB9C|nr:uncharacterized protein CGCS363_v012028 [Colletotrichum siamense]KAF5490000.1 hypothetical protein CGCS363_v012028 [Colletotrichum siamense]
MFRLIINSSRSAMKRSAVARGAYHRPLPIAPAHNRFSTTSRASFHPWVPGSHTYPQTAEWHVELSNQDVEKLLKDYDPKRVDEDYMCRAEGPDEMGNIVFHVYRRYTRGEQLRLQIATQDGRARITEITWETFGPSVQAEEWRAKRFAIEICREFLGCDMKGAK